MLVFICSLCVSRSPLPSARCLSKSKSSATRNILKRNGQHDHIASKCGQFWRNLVILVNSGDFDEASAIEYPQRWIAGKRFSCGHTCVQTGVNHYEREQRMSGRHVDLFQERSVSWF